LGNSVLLVDGEVQMTTLHLGGTSVTATAAELNYNDTGQSVGTVVASKVVTVDSSKDVSSFRNLTATGTLKSDGMQLTGGAESGADSGTVVAEFDVSEASFTDSGPTANTIASYAYGTYRTAKFVVQISDGSDFDATEILVTYKGASDPTASSNIFMTTYAYVGTAASDLGTFDAVRNSSNSTIDLQFTPASTGTYHYRVVKSLLIK
jgi:hypothetical protein